MNRHRTHARGPTTGIRDLLLTAAAAVGLVSLLAAAGSLLLGLQPLIFRSGSMEPAIGTGALAMAREVPADTVRPGDVVSVVSATGTRITHRVVSVSPGPVSTLVLQGDANERPDTEPYAVTRVDRVVVHVEHLGYLVSWLRHPAVIFAGGVLVGVLTSRAGVRGGPGRRPPPRRGVADVGSSPARAVATDTASPGSRPGPTTAATRARRSATPVRQSVTPVRRTVTLVRRTVTVAVVVLSLPLAVLASPTLAAFEDSAAAVSGSFATRAQLAAPVLSCSGLGVLAVDFTWTAVADATGYDLLLTSGGVTTTYTYPSPTTRANLTGALGSGTAVVRAKIGYPSTTWFSPASNVRSYTFAVVSLCS